MAYAAFSTTFKNSNVVLSGSDLTATGSGAAAGHSVGSTMFKSAGKWYCEFTFTGTAYYVGIANASATMADATVIGSDANGYCYSAGDGHKINNGSSAVYGATWAPGNKISVLWDADAGELSFWKDGSDQGVAYTGVSGAFGPAVTVTDGTTSSTVNTGDSAFTYTPPAGYSGWTYICATTGDAAVTLPALTAFGERKADAAVTFPGLTAVGGYNGSALLTFPMLSVSGSGGTNGGVVSLPVPVVAATGRQENYGQVDLPAFTALATGYDQAIWTFAGSAPAPRLSASGYSGEVLTAVLQAPVPILVATLDNPSVITAVLAVSAPRLLATLLSGTTATAALTAVAPIMAATGYPAYTLTFAGRAPAPYLKGATAELSGTVSETYRVWVLNLRKQALTEYGSWQFNSFATFNGQVLAAGASGVVVLGTQDKDNATNIDATVRTGKESFASSLLKRVPRIYTGLSAAGDMHFKTITVEGGTRTYLLPYNHVTEVQQRRVPVGKGPKSRYWQFEWKNVNGCDFSVDDVLVYPVKLRRRVQ